VLVVQITDGKDASTVVKNMKLWMAEVEKATGRKPIIYTFPSFWIGSLGNPLDFTDYPLWIADFADLSGKERLSIPSGWKTWTFWQYKGDVQTSSTNTTVDFNKFNGSLNDLRNFVKNNRNGSSK
jgi:lysozyme